MMGSKACCHKLQRRAEKLCQGSLVFLESPSEFFTPVLETAELGQFKNCLKCFGK